VPKIDTFRLIDNRPAASESDTLSGEAPADAGGENSSLPADQAPDPAGPVSGTPPPADSLAPPAQNGQYAAILTGMDLQNIAKVGWDAANGADVTDLPTPIPGQGLKQSLHVTLPAPVPTEHAPLYDWLRGDTAGRLTNIHD
jgi:hypothetical protein